MTEITEQVDQPQKSPKQIKKEQKQQKKLQKKREKQAKQYRLLFPANKKGKHVMHAMNFLRFLFYPLHRIVYPFKMYGAKKVPDGPFVYVGNHYNIFDIFYVAHTTGEGIHFMSKQCLFEKPILGWWMRKVGAISAMRDGSDIRTLMDAMKVLKNGEKVSLFPEGTRNKVSEEEFLPFHGGAALLAIKTQTPVIPFVICSRPRVFRMTNVVFGEPMELTEFYGKKLTPDDYDKADELLKQRLYELRAEHRAYLANRKKKRGKKD